jgi:O-antigen/teichoic acid export membrane protein
MLIRNSLANLAGQLLHPLLAIVLVPFYLRQLGLEAYGLIGLMALMVSLLGVFSKGLGGALQREVSRRTGSADAPTLRRLLRSMELLYWAMGAAIALALGVVAMAAGPRWIRADDLPSGVVATCLALLAVRVGVAFPHGVYQSVLVGSERQVLNSMLNAALALTSAAMSVTAVLLSGSVVAFYVTETIAAAAYAPVFRRFAFGVLPAGPVTFDASEIRKLIALSLALVWTSGVGLLLNNLDRLLVAAVLPIASLAVFTVAVMGGRLVTLCSNPFLQAVYPRTCRLVRAGSLQQQRRDLLRNAAVMTAMAAAVAVPLCGFAREALDVWLPDRAMVPAAAPVMSVYVMASVTIAFASVLYQWQTAAADTKTAVRFNTLALLWFPPVLWVLVSRAGLIGASLAWAAYGSAAWIAIAASTFRRDARDAAPAYLAVTVFALAPAVLATAAARAIADGWFAGDLAARLACAAGAAVCGGAGAIAVALPWLAPLSPAVPSGVEPRPSESAL